MYKIHKQYRLKNYDYSQYGGYFITICTKDRVEYFGNFNNGEMQVNEIGTIAEKFWNEIPDSFDGVQTDQFVVMPNHIHGIIILMKQEDNLNQQKTLDRLPASIQPLIKNSVSSIVNHYKGKVKRWCNKNDFEHFNWQARFYDHIIRNEKSLNIIREYIFYNPLKRYLEYQKNGTFKYENIFNVRQK